MKKPLLIFGSSVGRDGFTRFQPSILRAIGRQVGKSLEGWSCNGITLHGALPDRMFELHRRNYLRMVLGRSFTSYVDTLRDISQRKTLMLIEPWKELPAASLYPIKRVEALPHGRWHTSSFDWMLACAIAEGYRDITIAGMRFQRGGEPLGAPACISYWVGYAIGQGVRIHVMEDCDTLFKTYQLVESERQYGREDVVLVEMPRPKRLGKGRSHGGG